MSIKFQSFTYIMEHVKPKGVAFCMSSTSMERLRSNVRLVRLALSGALLGVAAVGIVARGLGHSGHFGLDLAGAGAGFAAVLIFKLSHFVWHELLDFLISAVSTIDGATVAVGVTAVAAKIPIRQILGHKPIFSSSGCASDLLNGVTLVPFGLMVGSAFFPNLLEHLAKTNIVLIAVSGGIGIFFVLGELLKAP